MGKRRSTYRIWWKTKRRWDIIKMDLEEEIGYGTCTGLV
jgi:hypothetical protein